MRSATARLPGTAPCLDDTPEASTLIRTGAAEALHDLNFDEKRAIVSRLINKVVGTQKELSVTGCLPIPTHVEYQLNDRDGVNATRHPANDNFPMLPFEFTIELPAPSYQTIKAYRKTRPAA